MEADYQELLERFAALGRIAENVRQRVGEHGRGIFPIDSTRSVKIMTPKIFWLILLIYALRAIRL